MRAHSTKFTLWKQLFFKTKRVGNLQTINFSTLSRKVHIEDKEYCLGNILVFIQLKSTHTRLFEDKITEELGQNDPFFKFMI